MFAYIHVHSPYSFGDGASEIEALVQQAAGLHMPALAITDHNSVTGAVKFAHWCCGYGIKPIIGAEVTMASTSTLTSNSNSNRSQSSRSSSSSREEGHSHLTLLAQTRTGFANLCRLLSKAYAHGGRLSPALPWEELEPHTEGLICLSGCREGAIPTFVRNHRYEEARALATRLRDWFGSEHFFLELQCDFIPQSGRVAAELVELAGRLGCGSVATN